MGMYICADCGRIASSSDGCAEIEEHYKRGQIICMECADVREEQKCIEAEEKKDAPHA